jgi:hypothetical protein
MKLKPKTEMKLAGIALAILAVMCIIFEICSIPTYSLLKKVDWHVAFRNVKVYEDQMVIYERSSSVFALPWRV